MWCVESAYGACITWALPANCPCNPSLFCGRVYLFSGERGEDHIKLDRTWLFEDVPYMSIYRVAQKPLHTATLHKTTRFLHESWQTQQAVTMCALLLDKLSRSVTSFSKLFDEESETGASFVERGRKIGEVRDWFMKASRKVLSVDCHINTSSACSDSIRVLYLCILYSSWHLMPQRVTLLHFGVAHHGCVICRTSTSKTSSHLRKL